jgi:hypothetical protein
VAGEPKSAWIGSETAWPTWWLPIAQQPRPLQRRAREGDVPDRRRRLLGRDEADQGGRQLIVPAAVVTKDNVAKYEKYAFN